MGRSLDQLMGVQLSALDLLPHADLREKLVELVLFGEPAGLDAELTTRFQRLRQALGGKAVEDVRVVVFGGGTGLSNLVGGDSRSSAWGRNPFVGLKEVFPRTRAIVCVTDDGGSTGELQKDLPLIALGDLRHVLLSSVQSGRLQALYGLSLPQAVEVTSILSALFNHRFKCRPETVDALMAQAGVELSLLPGAMCLALTALLESLFADSRLEPVLFRPHCLGNLLLAAAIYAEIPSTLSNDDLLADPTVLAAAMGRGLDALAAVLGAGAQAVLPCTSTQSQLSVLYSNGVQVIGEYKSGYAQRGYPVDRVFVEFSGKPHVFSEVFSAIAEADILIMAPGSLYSSLIPVLQVPGVAQAVRRNTRALKILVSNLWVQSGETDRSVGDAERKFHVSDMIRAYERNIPGGTSGLFDQVLCLSLKDVPASVLQNYAVEGKVPIYLDRSQVSAQGFTPIECGIFSRAALMEQGVIQHGPIHLAKVVQTLWAVFDHLKTKVQPGVVASRPDDQVWGGRKVVVPPLTRFRQIRQRLVDLSVEGHGALTVTGLPGKLRSMVQNILWRHRDIPLVHLAQVRGIACVEQELWRRSQQWDSVFSFYDPEDGLIKIREDQLEVETAFEVAFLVALGQSLLGNYAASKEMRALEIDGIPLGKVYHLYLVPAVRRVCWFSDHELRRYLELSRMLPAENDPTHFTRLINGEEGFTPPGMLMGLNYAWYLDNRFASHVEYKMAVMKIPQSDLIPEQVKMLDRRQRLVSFFREVVFRKPL